MLNMGMVPRLSGQPTGQADDASILRDQVGQGFGFQQRPGACFCSVAHLLREPTLSARSVMLLCACARIRLTWDKEFPDLHQRTSQGAPLVALVAACRLDLFGCRCRVSRRSALANDAGTPDGTGCRGSRGLFGQLD